MTDPDERVVLEVTVDELAAITALVGAVDYGSGDFDARELYDNLDAVLEKVYPGYDYEVQDEDIVLIAEK